MPDGRKLLLRGLDKAADPDEVSGVLAHEIGYVQRHDPTRETLRGMAIFLSDHPATADRAATLRVDGAETPAMDPACWAALRAMCREG